MSWSLDKIDWLFSIDKMNLTVQGQGVQGMKGTVKLKFGGMLFVVLGALIGWLTVSSTHAEGQTGNNAVYNNTGTGSCCVQSQAFTDASVFAATGSNFCSVVKAALTSTSFSGVVDARGLPFTTPATSMTCPSTQPSPWSGITSPPPGAPGLAGFARPGRAASKFTVTGGF
jgi:hypothetical protein